MKREYIYLALLAVLLAVIMDGTYVVEEGRQAIITQFGEPRGNPITEPGLHFKLPLVQKANYFEKRFLQWDGDADQMPTKDKRFISVDTYARWRITDPLLFFQRLRDERGAQSRLDGILGGETRNAIARHDLVEVVRSSNREEAGISDESEEETSVLEQITKGRGDITRSILETAAPKVKDFGIELIDLQFKRINYVEEVEKDVFARMIAERKRIAARYRSEGEGEAARIRGEQERELQRIQSEAYRSAQEVRGEADGKATGIYAKAYNQDPAFYAFMKSMETYESGVDSSTTLVLTTKGDLLKYLVRPQ
jgi:membrane protease subunit HflC